MTPLPKFGGTLWPVPMIVVPFTTDALGRVAVEFDWPVAPSGAALVVQVAVQDTETEGLWAFALSNGLRAVTN